MNHRSLFLVLIVTALGLLALVARSGGVLALAIPMLVFLLVALVTSPVSPDLSISRSVDRDHALVGERLRMKLVVTNRGDSIATLTVSDRLPGPARLVDGRLDRTFVLGAASSAELVYAFESQRGICSWDLVAVAASDPLGLFESRRRLHAPAEVIVRPGHQGDVDLPIHPSRTLRAPGPNPIPLAGPGTDFLGVREYQPGDSLRHINWRLAARHPGSFFTNEHERHEVGDFGLILDARFGRDDIFERAVGAAASLAEGILREGNRLSLLVFGRTMSAAHPGYGKHQLSLILRTLATATRSSNLAFDYLDYFPRRLFPNRSVLVVISAVLPADAPMYARLRAAGFDVVLISPDPVDGSDAGAHPGSAPDWASRIARIERRSTLLALSKLGVNVVDWPSGEPLGRVLRQLSPRRMRPGKVAL